MKKEKLRPAGLFLFVLAVVLAAFVLSAQSAVSEEAATLQRIAPYRTWGKANVKPIVVPIDRAALSG
jgi:serine protease inhibitor ecotin